MPFLKIQTNRPLPETDADDESGDDEGDAS